MTLVKLQYCIVLWQHTLQKYRNGCCQECKYSEAREDSRSLEEVDPWFAKCVKAIEKNCKMFVLFYFRVSVQFREQTRRWKKENERTGERKGGEWRREGWIKDERSKHGSRWRWTSSPGMKSTIGSAAAVPPATDRWDSGSEVRGQRGRGPPTQMPTHSHLTWGEIDFISFVVKRSKDDSKRKVFPNLVLKSTFGDLPVAES